MAEGENKDLIWEARIVEAKQIGWKIDRCLQKLADGPAFFMPPSHFECSRRHWAARFMEKMVDHELVMIPSWFLDDNVMRFGTTQPPRLRAT